MAFMVLHLASHKILGVYHLVVPSMAERMVPWLQARWSATR
jgi:hypothetical protein